MQKIENGVPSLMKLAQKKQARKPRSYASPKLCPPTHSLTHLLTGVKCRATSVAKNNLWNNKKPKYVVYEALKLRK